MKYLNIWFFIILIVVLVASFFFAVSTGVVCVDGMRINPDKLMQYCNVTLAQYNEQVNDSFCPDAMRAYEPIGGCHPVWSFTWGFTIAAAIGYIMLYSLIFLIIRARENNAPKQ